jgi:hypothetical protein
MAAHLSGGLNGAGENTKLAQGYIVCETNYRVYAYTSSPLNLAILRLFTRYVQATNPLIPNASVLKWDNVIKSVSVQGCL